MRLRDLKPVQLCMTKSRYIMETICATTCGTKLEQDKNKMKTFSHASKFGVYRRMFRAQSYIHYWFKFYLIFKL